MTVTVDTDISSLPVGAAFGRDPDTLDIQHANLKVAQGDGMNPIGTAFRELTRQQSSKSRALMSPTSS